MPKPINNERIKPKAKKANLNILKWARKNINNYKKNRKIKVNSFEKKLCGKFRPGHFRAVVDVINRFIKIIEPKKRKFVKKSYADNFLN